MRGANLLEKSSTDEDGGLTVGRNPSTVPQAELIASGHLRRPLLAVIRSKCLECCRGAQSEVRKCTAISCPLWPYRMGKNPLREPMSEERRAEIRQRFASARADGGSNVDSEE